MLLVPGTLAGQTVGTATGSIVGTVTDSTGAVLSGVTITATSDALMGQRIATTDSEGHYRIVALAPGNYDLSFALAGFRTTEANVIRIAVGFTATLDVVLPLVTVSEGVTVPARSGFLDRHATAVRAGGGLRGPDRQEQRVCADAGRSDQHRRGRPARVHDVDREGVRDMRAAAGRAHHVPGPALLGAAVRTHLRHAGSRIRQGGGAREPIGTRRMQHVTTVDLRVEKRIPLRGNRRLAGFLDVLNLLNAKHGNPRVLAVGIGFPPASRHHRAAGGQRRREDRLVGGRPSRRRRAAAG